MEFSTIQPFKAYFNVDFTEKPKKESKREKKSVSLTEDNFSLLDESYIALK